MVLMMIPYGGQVGTIACVGKAMGEGKAKKAKTYIKIGLVLMFFVDLALGILIFTLKNYLVLIFTSN